MQCTPYSKDMNEEVVIKNTDEIEGYFRYPDLTAQCIYLICTILSTIEEDMPGELLFIH